MRQGIPFWLVAAAAVGLVLVWDDADVFVEWYGETWWVRPAVLLLVVAAMLYAAIPHRKAVDPTRWRGILVRVLDGVDLTRLNPPLCILAVGSQPKRAEEWDARDMRGARAVIVGDRRLHRRGHSELDRLLDKPTMWTARDCRRVTRLLRELQRGSR